MPAPPLDPFLDELQIPEVRAPHTVGPDGTRYYRIDLRAGKRKVHSQLPAETPFWGYEGLYPGPTIETPKDSKVVVEFVNALPVSEQDPRKQWPFFIPDDVPGSHMHVFVPRKPWTVVHLHGSPSPADSDGWTDNAYFPGGSAVHHYPPQLSAALLWYHDHANMITRLNVYAGLAGLYLVRDAMVETQLGLPVGPPFELPLLLQDRNLEEKGDTYTGRFAYQALNSNAFFTGSHVVVNGTIAPHCKAKPARYRLRILNGANARFFRLALQLPDGSPPTTQLMTQIGVDGGFLPQPVRGPRTRVVKDSGVTDDEVLTLAPAERADVLLDLSEFPAGAKVELVDLQPFMDPIPVLRFVIQPGPPAPPTVLSATPARSRRLPPVAAPPTALEISLGAVLRRPIGLIPRVTAEGEPLMLTLNDRLFHDTVEEQPELDSVEEWDFLNMTGEDHPLHLHLVNFEVLDRRGIVVEPPDPEYDKKAAGYFRAWLGMPLADRPPLPQGLQFNTEAILADPNEVSPKDTVRVPAWSVTRIRVAFKFHTGMYMYHCHILEHEDMEMMRPLLVVPQGMHSTPAHDHHGHG